MASLRGSTELFDSATVNPADATTIYSKVAYPDADPYVVIYISSNHDSTWDVEVGFPASGKTAAGRNAFNSSSLPDGGLLWFKYLGATALSISANVPAAYDLSPFGAQYVRIVRTDNGVSATVDAFLSSTGVN